MARLELSTQRDVVQAKIDNSPSLAEAYRSLVKDGALTISYLCFVRSWKKITAEEQDTDPADRDGRAERQQEPTVPMERKKSVAASASKRRAVAEQTIGSFKHDPHPGDLEW